MRVRPVGFFRLQVSVYNKALYGAARRCKETLRHLKASSRAERSGIFHPLSPLNSGGGTFQLFIEIFIPLYLYRSLYARRRGRRARANGRDAGQGDGERGERERR